MAWPKWTLLTFSEQRLWTQRVRHIYEDGADRFIRFQSKQRRERYLRIQKHYTLRLDGATRLLFHRFFHYVQVNQSCQCRGFRFFDVHSVAACVNPYGIFKADVIESNLNDSNGCLECAIRFFLAEVETCSVHSLKGRIKLYTNIISNFN